MPNAKNELLTEIEIAKSTIKCAIIVISTEYGERHFELKCHHTDDELNVFVDSLDIDYYKSFKSQALHGTVWFENGNWLERIFDDDFYEYWELRECPEIPIFLW